MADGANKLLKENTELVNQSNSAWATYTATLKTAAETQKQLNTQLKDANGAKQFAQVQKEIQGNIKNVALAEKELIKVESLRAKEQEKLTRETLKTSQAQEKAANATKRLNGVYQQASKRLTTMRNDAKNLGIQFGVNSKQFKTAAAGVRKLDTELKRLDARLGQSQRFVGQYGRALGGLKNILGAAGIVGGVQLFVSTLRNALKIGKEYEKSNAVLASVLGKTRKETVLLQKESKRLGASTAFSASQVTELQTELARLGKSEKEIVDTTEAIIDATISFGSATGETAALVGSTLNAFNLSASESSRVVDVLVLATQRSALSFEKLNTALPTVSGAAKAAGVSLETMVAQLGQAADRGLDASTAATSLRNIYITLAEKGLTLDDALRDINESQDKLSTATQLFGKRAAVTALALADNIDKTEALDKALQGAGGTAEKVAKEQLGTLDGALKLLNSAWEGFVLSINNSETALGSFAKKAVTSATDAIIGITNIGLAAKAAFKGLDELTNEELEQFLSVMRLEESDISIIETLDALKNKYEELPSIITGVITLQENLTQEIVKAGESQEDAERIVQAYINILDEKKDADEEAAKAVEDQNKEISKQAGIIKTTTDAIDSRGMIAIGTEHDIQAELVETTKVYEDAEKLKTEIFKEESQKRSDVEAEFIQGLQDSAISIGDSLFDIKQEQLLRESELIAEEYDNRLANEELDQEQRDLIEAERTQKENELAKKQRDLEKKQFLYNQGIKAGELGISTAQKVAEIQANVALLLSNPITAPFAPVAAAQIPFVIGTGAAGLAAIFAKSVPAFDKGTESTPKDYLAGEKRPEFRIDKHGNVSLVDSPTLFTNDAGSKIIGGAESAKMIDQMTRQEVISSITNHEDNVQNKMIALAIDKSMRKSSDRIVSAINRQQLTVNSPDYRTMDLRNDLRG